jgi:hypothetical protein
MHAFRRVAAAASARTSTPMLLLFETPAGYSLFKVKDEKKLSDVEVRRARVRAMTRTRDANGRCAHR